MSCLALQMMYVLDRYEATRFEMKLFEVGKDIIEYHDKIHRENTIRVIKFCENQKEKEK